MSKTTIFTELSRQLWDNEMINQSDYNYDYNSFENDFLSIFTRQFDDIIFIQGNVVE